MTQIKSIFSKCEKEYIIDQEKNQEKFKQMLEEVINNSEKRYVWVFRGFHSTIRRLDFFKEIINEFVREKKQKEAHAWSIIHRGIFYKGVQAVYFFELYNPNDSFGATIKNPQEIVFDECNPIYPSEYLKNEKKQYEILLSNLCLSKQPLPKLVFIGQEKKGWMFEEESEKTYPLNSFEREIEKIVEKLKVLNTNKAPYSQVIRIEALLKFIQKEFKSKLEEE